MVISTIKDVLWADEQAYLQKRIEDYEENNVVHFSFGKYLFFPFFSKAEKRWPAIADPDFQMKFHDWATTIWFILAFPICIFLSTSIPLLVFISVYAIVTGHWASWQAARTESMQKAADQQMSNTIKEISEILDRMRRLDKDAPFTPDDA